MKREFEYVRAYERDLIENNAPRNTLFNAMHNMAFLKWDFDAAHKMKLTNVRTLIDTTPSDAMHNASIALSNTVPRWEVAPYGSSLFEFQRTEKLEHCLAWNFNKMNMRGTGTLLYDKMWSSLLYDTIATRVDDLDFHFKGVGQLSPLQKEMRRQGRFYGQVFDPRSIHTEFSMGTFSALLHVENLRAIDVYNYFRTFENSTTDEGKQIRQALEKMNEKMLGKQPQEIRNLRFVLYEFYTHDQIMRHGHFTGTGSNNTTIIGTQAAVESGTDDIVFVDQENPLGFMNWSVRIGGSRIERQPEYQVNPMLAPLHWGNSWETSNILRSLVMSEPIKRMLEQVKEVHSTRDGKPLPVNEDGVAAGFQDEKITHPGYPPLDPNAPAIVQQLQQEIIKTTGASVLSDVTSAKTTPFATLNAMIQVAMSRLDINRRDGALSCADDALIMLRWVDKTKRPLMSYRQKPKTMNVMNQLLQMQAGEQVVVDPRDYDLEQCEINVNIHPKTPTDFQQQVMTAIQLNKQLKIPWQYVIERFVGVENAELLKNQWEDEQFNDAEIGAAIQHIMASQQMQDQMQAQQAQQAQMQQQQGAQPPNPGEPMAQAAFGQLGGGQGLNPAMMGQSPNTFAPGLTRETISGQTQGGAPLAAGG